MTCSSTRTSSAGDFFAEALGDLAEPLLEAGDDRAYMQLQLARLDVPARPGVAY